MFERLAAVEGPEPSEFAIRRIEDDAKKLLHKDPLGANTVLGAIAALRRDQDAVDRQHGLVVDADPSPTNWYNYGTSLALLENDERGLEVAAGALEHYPGDLDLLDLAIGSSQRLGCFTRALEFCERWRVVAGRNHAQVAYTRELCGAMDRGLFTEKGARRLVSLGHEVQRDSLIRRTRVAQFLRDEASFLLCWDVYADLDRAAALNERLADRMANNEALMSDPGLAFTIMFVGRDEDD